MKLLLDENLSRRIVPQLQSNYPGTSHVGLLGLERAEDREIWNFARAKGFIVVTKDDDFQGLVTLEGPPPKVIRLRMGNCGNQQVVEALSRNAAAIESTLADRDIGIVELY